MTRALVFDLGGVVLRWQPAELLRQALPALALDAHGATRLSASFFQSFEPGGDWALFDRGAIDERQVVERIAARIGLPAGAVQAVVDAVPAHLQPRPDMVALLASLRERRVPIYYLSNMPAPFAQRLLDDHPFFGWFADGVFSSRLQMVKPERPIFDEASRRFGLDPGEALFIDDSAANIEAARALGWAALHFVDPAQCERDLRARGLLG